MPTYDFRCPDGHEFEALVALKDSQETCPTCGKGASRLFSPTSACITPAYMKAPGSIGSTSDFADKNRQYLGSQKHVAMRQQDERIAERISRGEQSFEKHMRDSQWKIDYLEATGRKPEKGMKDPAKA